MTTEAAWINVGGMIAIALINCVFQWWMHRRIKPVLEKIEPLVESIAKGH